MHSYFLLHTLNKGKTSLRIPVKLRTCALVSLECGQIRNIAHSLTFVMQMHYVYRAYLWSQAVVLLHSECMEEEYECAQKRMV